MKKMNKSTLDYYNQNFSLFSADTVNADMHVAQDRFLSVVERFHPDAIPFNLMLLDFGCGTGRDTRYFLDKGYHVHAIDGSEEMVRIASQNTGINVELLLFENFDSPDTYDGIWACASILHLPWEDLVAVYDKMCAALKKNGIMYVGFKYGDFEGDRNGRYYTDMNEERFARLTEGVPEVSIIESWLSADVRPGRDNEKWFNALLVKK